MGDAPDAAAPRAWALLEVLWDLALQRCAEGWLGGGEGVKRHGVLQGCLSNLLWVKTNATFLKSLACRLKVEGYEGLVRLF